MKNAKFAGRIFNTPLMIAEEKLNVLLHVLGPRFDLDLDNLPAIEAREVSETERSRAGYVVRDGAAIIGIQGTLVHKSGYLDALSGLTSYESLRGAFDTAMDDDQVRRIIFDVDSPGGEVTGCFDLVDHIYKSRGKKPITAVVNESCYSAAYALASAADKIILPRTGGAGSVGVILCHIDQSAFNEKAGVKVTHIYAGKHKADFSPHHALSEEAVARLQGMVDDTYQLFVSTVARNRGLGAEAVRKTEAGIFIGKKAVSAGLADRVAAVDKYLTGSSGSGSPLRMAAEEPAQVIDRAKNQEPIAREYFADPATSAAAYDGRPAIDKATEREKAIFGGQARQDAGLLTAKENAAQSFEQIAAWAYARRENARREQQQTAEEQGDPQRPATQNTRPPANDSDRLAAIAARVYGPEA
jgi:signal peptide peptidase SppA